VVYDYVYGNSRSGGEREVVVRRANLDVRGGYRSAVEYVRIMGRYKP